MNKIEQICTRIIDTVSKPNQNQYETMVNAYWDEWNEIECNEWLTPTITDETIFCFHS